MVGLLVVTGSLFGWRSWFWVDEGALVSGIGGVGAPLVESPASIDVQPASVGLPSEFRAVWGVSASLRIVDPLSGRYDLSPDPFSLVGVSYGGASYGVGVVVRRLLSSLVSDFRVYGTSLGVAMNLGSLVRVGVIGGAVWGFEQQQTVLGYRGGAGILWQVAGSFTVGVSGEMMSPLVWKNTIYGEEVQESFPFRVRSGVAWKYEGGQVFFQIRYTDGEGLRFDRDGVVEKPEVSFLSSWDVYAGWRGKLPWRDIPVHCGVFSDQLWTTPYPLRQWAFAFGVVAMGKNVRITLTWVDSYLFSLVSRDVLPRERGMVDLTYRF